MNKKLPLLHLLDEASAAYGTSNVEPFMRFRTSVLDKWRAMEIQWPRTEQKRALVVECFSSLCAALSQAENPDEKQHVLVSRWLRFSSPC